LKQFFSDLSHILINPNVYNNIYRGVKNNIYSEIVLEGFPPCLMQVIMSLTFISSTFVKFCNA